MLDVSAFRRASARIVTAMSWVYNGLVTTTFLSAPKLFHLSTFVVHGVTGVPPDIRGLRVALYGMALLLMWLID